MVALSPTARSFILHWGEMGPRWGVNRSVAQIHALLYISQRPLSAEEIAEALSLARSNVSTSLRELLSWQIVRRVPVMGDRREFYESLTDVWEMFQIILDERKRREIDPTIDLLEALLEETGRGSEALRGRLEAMRSFFQTMSDWYEQIRALPPGAVNRFVRMGRKVGRLLGVAG